MRDGEKTEKNLQKPLHSRRSGGIIAVAPCETASKYTREALCGTACPESKEVRRMAKCEFCDKGVTFGIKVSHSHRRSNRTWKPNVKRVKAIVDGSPRHVYVCTRCLRSGKVTRAV